MALKRRAFLQQAGAALAGLGLGEAGFAQLANRYQQALAQPTRRKLALLVGINQYPEAVCDYIPVKGSALTGCLTDVALQQELLTHRFGFLPSDILVLTDQLATREAIVESFRTHLIQQAKPGDLVLFHFSGLGSWVQQLNAAKPLQAANSQSLSEPTLEATLAPSLVPVDGLLPTADRPVLQDLMQTTLGLLLQALPTQEVITVLDIGYSRLGRNLQGSLRLRSRPAAPVGQLSDTELAWQDQLSRSTTASPLVNLWAKPANPLPGLVLQASAVNQSTSEALAAETQWNGFSAGLFTYALTQQLWESTPSLGISLSPAVATVQQLAGNKQMPSKTGSLTSSLTSSATRFSQTGAEGVIRTVTEEGKLRIWLAGLPAVVLENAESSLFTVEADSAPSNPVNTRPAPSPPYLLQLKGREGLVGKARVLKPEASSQLRPGHLVRELVRVIPQGVGLTVGLDSSLERIERVDATSAFATIPRISAVVAGEQPADFLFGKLQPPLVVAAVTALQSSQESSLGAPASQPLERTKSSYGLFLPGRSAIPNSLNSTSEAVKTAVARMASQLKTLLALKLLRLTQNQAASGLNVRAALELASSQRPLIQQATGRLPNLSPNLSPSGLASPTLIAGSLVQYQFYNDSSQPLYVLVTGLDPAGNAVVLYVSAPVPPAEQLLLPVNPANGLGASPGLAETYLICSIAPFSQTERAITPKVAKAGQMIALTNPLEVAQAILQDIHRASADRLPPAEIPADAYALEMSTWATLGFIYPVIES
jgi:hypothetical protein